MAQVPDQPGPFGPPGVGPSFTWRDDALLQRVPADTVRLLSVDLFDTLLIRTNDSPDALFRAVARRAQAQDPTDMTLAPPLFAALRRKAAVEAERDLGAARVTLAEIYRRLPAALLPLERLMVLEVEIEAEGVRINPLVADLIAEMVNRGVPVVATSDMYFGHQALTTLLRRAGFDSTLFRGLYVSSELGQTKREGGLFPCLLRDVPDLNPAHLCHIGDDPQADDLVPRRFGITTVLYARPARLRRICGRERLVGGPTASGGEPGAVRRVAATLSGDGSDKAAFWHGFGTLVLAPVLVRYAVWVVDSCHRLGIEHAAVFMREARLLAELMTAYGAARGYALTVAPLWISRQALARTEVPPFDRAGVCDLIERRPYLRVADLLALAPDVAVPVPLREQADRVIEQAASLRLGDGGSLLDAIAAWFAQPAVRTRLMARAEQDAQMTARYLAEAFGPAQRVALVDLGARATTAAAIHRLQALRDRPRLHAFLLYATDAVTGALTQGLPVSVFAGSDPAALAIGRRLYRSPQPLERLLTGLDDCTVGYRETVDGRVEPICQPTAAIGAERQALHWVSRGVRDYWACWLAMAGRSGFRNPEAAEPAGAEPSTVEALRPWEALIQLPLPDEARCLGQLSYDYNDGSPWVRRICDEPALAAVRAVLTMEEGGPLLARLSGLRPQTVPWPQGAATVIDPESLRHHYSAVDPDPDHGAYCRAAVARIKRAGLDRIALFAAGGAGGMGGAFIEAAREEGLLVVAYADHLPQMVAADFCGVPVTEPSRLVASAPHAIALVSLGYQAAMLESLCAVLPQPRPPIYTLDHGPIRL